MRWLAVVVWLAAGIALAGCGDDQVSGDPGRLTETIHSWTPADGPLPELTDVTTSWGLDGWAHSTSLGFGGPVAVGDLDGDGFADIVAGGDDVGVFFGTGGGFERAVGPLVGDSAEVTAIGIGDLDGDGLNDLVLGRIGVSDTIVWGGQWAIRRDLTAAEISTLPGGVSTTGFAVADLNGDGVNDLFRLGYGNRTSGATPDVIFEQAAPRQFDAVELPNSDRLSFAMEAADVDADGLLDLWVTRDVGWIQGADSVYSRRGDASGDWTDIAKDLGVDLEIDGMGVTIADLAGDERLDTYITDVGENELLIGTEGGYEAGSDHGAARIRPPDVPADQVSSSWGVGTADVNLDGRADIVMTNGAFGGFFNKIESTFVLIEDPPAILLGLGDGRFADVWPELGLPWSGSSRGMALGDLDADGDTDVVIVNRNQGLRVYRNDSHDRSLTVRLAGLECTVAGASVRIEVEGRVIAQVLTAHTFLGVHAPEAIVGVREAGQAQIELTIPGFEPLSLEAELDGDRTQLDVACPRRE